MGMLGYVSLGGGAYRARCGEHNLIRGSRLVLQNLRIESDRK